MKKTELIVLLKKYAFIIFASMGVGGYLGGLLPVLAFQHDADFKITLEEITQTNKKIDQFACMQIIVSYLNAKKSGDNEMTSYWLQQAQVFGCTLPT